MAFCSSDLEFWASPSNLVINLDENASSTFALSPCGDVLWIPFAPACCSQLLVLDDMPWGSFDESFHNGSADDVDTAFMVARVPSFQLLFACVRG